MARKIDPSLIPSFPTLEYESALWREGYQRLAGIDEAGRGPLAGPLCASAVILPANKQDLTRELFGVRDSKQLSPRERQRYSLLIQQIALDFSIAWVSADEIDRMGMAKAGREVFLRAINLLKSPPDGLLLDYFDLPQLKIHREVLVRGDQRSLSIASASILAKTARDDYMLTLDSRYPLYDFANNKGYASPAHRVALQKLGPCPEHRLSFCTHIFQTQLFTPDEQKPS